MDQESSDQQTVEKPHGSRPTISVVAATVGLVIIIALVIIPEYVSENQHAPSVLQPVQTEAGPRPQNNPTQTEAEPRPQNNPTQTKEVPADLLATSLPPDLPYTTPQLPPLSLKQIYALVERLADQYLIERALAHAVVFAESKYDPFAVSNAGAIGLMQVMPSTASDYGVTAATDLFDPEINLNTGMRHLRRLLDKYDGNVGHAVMAYNAGEGAVDRAETNITYPETLGYTENVIRAYIGNGGGYAVAPTLGKIEQLRMIGNAGIVTTIKRKSIDLAAVTLEGMPELIISNIDQRLRAK